MNKIERIIKNTFTMGSIRDAAVFLEICVKNAFPEFHFRGIEIVNFLPSQKAIEGKSWNHNISVIRIEKNGEEFWQVECSRSSDPELKTGIKFLKIDTLEPID